MSERRPRKPLIEPGSVLGEQPDILSSVLNSYADRTGQPAPFAPEPTAPPATPSDAAERKPESPEEGQGRAEPNTFEIPVSKPASQPVDKPTRTPKAARGKADDTDAEGQARSRSETPKRLCSYRIPEGLDDWLEEHAFAHRHAGLKKQDLVAEAIRLLIVAKAGPAREDEA